MKLLKGTLLVRHWFKWYIWDGYKTLIQIKLINNKEDKK